MAGLPNLSDCKPGLRATGFNVLVCPEQVDEKVGSIYLPDSARDKEQIVQIRGRLVSVSPVAFDNAVYPPDTAPKAGDAILFAKLAGIQVDGADGRKYRLITDKDVAAIIEEAA